MINNTNPQIGVHTHNDNKQITEIKNTLSQLQAFSSATSATSLPSTTLESLLQLVQSLIKELGNDAEKGKGNSNSNPKTDEKKSTIGDILIGIIGTEGDDKIEGSRSDDHISGLGGDDRIFGRQGNDVLRGDSGNDRLYGGRGDDRLEGGTGDDYLAGGRGNNRLFGGDGNDILNSRLGNDFLDGGRGMDTARIRANIDEYTIEVGQQPPPATGADDPSDNDLPALGTIDRSKITLTHKETGQKIEIINTENFRFNDERLTLDELKDHAGVTNTTPPNNAQVALSGAEKEAVMGVFGNAGASGALGDASIRVIDNDGDGRISAGDTAVLATGNANSVSQQFKDLSDDDITTIKDHIKEGQVSITAAQQQAIQAVTGLRDIHVDDSDNSGSLSEGDVVVSSVPNTQKHELTVSDLEAVNSFQPPYLDNLNPTQINAVATLTGFSDFRIDDNDLSGKLSVGDTVVSSDSNMPNVTLDAEDIRIINENS